MKARLHRGCRRFESGRAHFSKTAGQRPLADRMQPRFGRNRVRYVGLFAHGLHTRFGRCVLSVSQPGLHAQTGALVKTLRRVLSGVRSVIIARRLRPVDRPRRSCRLRRCDDRRRAGRIRPAGPRVPGSSGGRSADNRHHATSRAVRSGPAAPRRAGGCSATTTCREETRAIQKQDAVALSGEQHRGRRARAAGTDDNHVVHGPPKQSGRRALGIRVCRTGRCRMRPD
jgi:hypothetical protein